MCAGCCCPNANSRREFPVLSQCSSVPADIPQLKIKVTSKEVMKGGSVNVTCQVISSNPDYRTVSWVKDGQPLKGQKLTLPLQPVTKDMSGKYRCQVLNDLGLGQSEEVALTVLCEFP